MRPVEVDAIALLEVSLRFARDHGREVEDDVGSAGDQPRRDARLGEIRDQHGGRFNDIDQIDLADTIAGESLRKLAPDHARRASDEDPHSEDS